MSNRSLTALVDKALSYGLSFGSASARFVFINCNIPSTVAARVLFHHEQRRPSQFGKIPPEEASRSASEIKCAIKE